MIKKFYTLLLLVSFFSITSNGQSFISVGYGSLLTGSNTYGPMRSNTGGTINWNRHAYIYPQSLLSGIYNGSNIDSIAFYRTVSTLAPGVLNGTTTFKIYLKNTTNTAFAAAIDWVTETGTATKVYDNDPASKVGSTDGFKVFNFTTPFAYTGNNLEILVEYTQSAGVAAGTEILWLYDNNNSGTTPVPEYVTNSIRYTSGTTAIPTTSSLSSANTRHPYILLFYTLPPVAVDASLQDITVPTNMSCYSTAQNMSAILKNTGTSPMNAGTASVTLRVSGSNTFTSTKTNSGTLAPGATETINFTGINLSNPGVHTDSFYVSISGDPYQFNDTLVSGGITATTITTFPAVEDVESDPVPVFPYFRNSLIGDRSLWTYEYFGYRNADMPTGDSIYPHGGQWWYKLDSYSGTNSTGISDILYSNCFTLPAVSGGPCSPQMTFFMSHDTLFSLPAPSRDSLYVTVSTDKGITWTRVGPGFARIDPTFTTPGWKQETVDLAAYAGQTIQIGFEGVSDYGNVIGIDDIEVKSGCPVPVTLVDFNAQRKGKINKLSWTTAQEINTSRFIVERSNDGRNFTSIGTVNASGNSNSSVSYTFNDQSPVKGSNYYRLKIVDNDNQYRFSAIRNIRNEGTADVAIYPNPAGGTLNLQINADDNDKALISVSDMSGKTVATMQSNINEGNNQLSMNISNLSTGSYLVKIHLNNDVIVKKINKR